MVPLVSIVASRNKKSRNFAAVHQLTRVLQTPISDYMDPEMIRTSFETLESLLLEHGYGEDDIARLNQDCIREVSLPFDWFTGDCVAS